MIRTSRFIAFSLNILLFATQDASAQFTTVINVPPDVSLGFLSADTQLNLFDGGTLSSLVRTSATGLNTEVNIHGGVVANAFRFENIDTVNLAGGTVGDFVNLVAVHM
jgi:hypothetical protein